MGYGVKSDLTDVTLTMNNFDEDYLPLWSWASQIWSSSQPFSTSDLLNIIYGCFQFIFNASRTIIVFPSSLKFASDNDNDKCIYNAVHLSDSFA